MTEWFLGMIVGIGVGVPFWRRDPLGGGSGPSGDALLLESGDYVLLESGDFLLLE